MSRLVVHAQTSEVLPRQPFAIALRLSGSKDVCTCTLNCDVTYLHDSEVESPTKMLDAKVPLNEISNSDKLILKDKPSDKHSTDNGVKSNKKCFDRNRNKFSNRHYEVEQNTVRKSTLLEK
ncbi:hypothetical protein AVEN_195009-1, partial [Araneus ventricosus]